MISNSPNRGYSLDSIMAANTEIMAIEGGGHLESGQYMTKQSNWIGRRTVQYHLCVHYGWCCCCSEYWLS
jgi:hypothetical protein